jgi:hypothetical protein
MAMDWDEFGDTRDFIRGSNVLVTVGFSDHSESIFSGDADLIEIIRHFLSKSDSLSAQLYIPEELCFRNGFLLGIVGS